MNLSNSQVLYGIVTKSFHWLTALLIFTAIPLALIAERLPEATSEDIALKATIFSLHKTIGVSIFGVALLRIIWAVTQTKPAPLHPDRRAETFLAEAVHWCLYAALLVVPLSGWIGHAASEGFAPIWWPFGQSLPLVAKSESLSHLAGTTHWVFTKVLIGSLILHVAGALKHVIIDRDGTLSRMWFGRADIEAIPSDDGPGPAVLLAAAVYVFGAVAVLFFAYEPSRADSVAASDPAAPTDGNWQVQDGTITITVEQMGAAIQGTFADWTASITFAEDATDGDHGSASVTIQIASLTLGSVTEQAMGTQYFNVDAFPTATYDAKIVAAQGDYVAEGTLSLAGQTVPVNMPFTLTIDGDTANMQGSTTLDRREFGIGDNQSDAGTLGFSVEAAIDLTATRSP